jgi:hypothetical protein
MMMRRLCAMAGVFVFIVVASGLAFAAKSRATDEPGYGFDMNNLDRSCKPCDDFFQFSEGLRTRR